MSAASPLLQSGTVHVWRLPLDLDPARLARLAALLDVDEHARAARFRLERDRQRFIATHGWLRYVLAKYLLADPRSLSFGAAARGKPCLMGSATDWLRFNLAHSDGLGLLAVAREVEVGVDLEGLGGHIDLQLLATRYLSVGERSGLANAPLAQQASTFLRLWTRKEAVLKATGDGLYLPLSEIDVDIEDVQAGRAAPLHVRDGSGADRALLLCDLDPGDSHVAALAVESSTWALELLEPGPAEPAPD